MMRNFFLSLFLLASLSAFSQKNIDIDFLTADQCVDKYNVPKVYMLADEVNVRACPGTDCRVVGQMRIGQAMKPLARSTKIDTIRGVKSYWFKIQAGEIEGWIFGAFIAKAAFGSQTDPSVKFVFGIEKIEKKDRRPVTTYQLRAFRGQTQLDKISLNSFSWGFGGVRNLGSKGLALDDIIALDVPCVGGCGCTTGEVLVFWNGRTFSDIQRLVGIADAWASESSEFVYPSDMEGEPDVIIREDWLFLEETNGGYKRQIVRVFFKWNGHKLVKDSSRPKQVKTYVTD
ncbi:MAG: SH3 domain-containing protein [Bacteroidota bacterium]